jgi:hypothetical protein
MVVADNIDVSHKEKKIINTAVRITAVNGNRIPVIQGFLDLFVNHISPPLLTGNGVSEKLAEISGRTCRPAETLEVIPGGSAARRVVAENYANAYSLQYLKSVATFRIGEKGDMTAAMRPAVIK